MKFFFLLTILSSVLFANEERPTIVLSFDDFPMESSALFEKQERVRIYLDALKQTKVTTVFFCIGERIAANGGEQCVTMLRQHPHFLANHSYHHQHLSKLPLDVFEAEIAQTDALLTAEPHFRKWFRFPYLDYGDRYQSGGTDEKRVKAFELLTSMGYRHGFITINTFDWYIDGKLKKAAQAGAKVDLEQLQVAYLTLLEEWMDDYHAQWSQSGVGTFTHVLLLHQNDLNAIFLKQIVALIEQKKWTIVSPEKAFNPPCRDLSTLFYSKKPPALTLEHIDEVLQRCKAFPT